MRSFIQGTDCDDTVTLRMLARADSFYADTINRIIQ